MRILMVASEVGPFARTGGLGDVVGALPQAMTKLGHEVIVAIPWYGTIDPVLTKKAKLSLSISTSSHGDRVDGEVYTLLDRKSKVTYWFVKADKYFDRAELYRNPSTGEDYIDNDERFLFFAKAVLEMAEKSKFDPQVIHCHDWQAGLIPVLLKYAPERHPALQSAKTLLTIHNLGYQGLFPPATFDKLELAPELFHAVTGPLEFYEQVNFLKGAIIASDKINTVSTTYAQEIQTKEYGAGLEGVLKARSEDLSGIVNGVDYAVWSPTRDKKIPFKYSRATLGGKRNCKVELMNLAGLPIREKVPLIGLISRLADQKGFDLIQKGIDELMEMDIQMIILGTGEKKYHDLLEKLELKYPDKFKAYLAFDDSLAHQIEAGSDLFLMPSLYEPCGLNQLYSLKYGTVPIVRKTGGLADTVIDYDPVKLTGTGFVFEEYTVRAMLEAIERAVRLFKKNRTWMKLVKEGMKQDFSWSASAKKYSELYDSMVS